MAALAEDARLFKKAINDYVSSSDIAEDFEFDLDDGMEYGIAVLLLRLLPSIWTLTFSNANRVAHFAYETIVVDNHLFKFHDVGPPSPRSIREVQWR